MHPVASPRRKPRSLAVHVVDQLSADIRSGRLPIGAKLPTETAIMGAFGVSRTVVREAMSRLQAAALVETRHGVGTFVLEPNPIPAFRIHPEQHGTLRDVIALLEFRISVETEAAALAALRRSDAQLQTLQDALSAFGEAIEAGRDAVHADFQFHQAVAQATQNHHYLDLLQSLGLGVIPRKRLDYAALKQPERLAYLRRVNQEHESIYQAIRAQDAEAARAAMRTHLCNSRDRLQRDGAAPP